MPKKLKWETFTASAEYIIWVELDRVCNEFKISEDTFFEKTDLGGLYWEPLLDRILKLAVMVKCNCKIKNIKFNWIRPILYFGAQSNGIVEFDGRRDIVDKGAIGEASVLRYSFKNLINHMHEAPKLEEKTFHAQYKAFKKELKYFFSHLSKYVKNGYRQMHEHVKLILYPLRELRRSGYRLFSLEKLEENYTHLTVFKDKKDLRLLEESIIDEFKWDQFKLVKKDTDREMLMQFLKKEIDEKYFTYTFVGTVREADDNDNDKQTTGDNGYNPYETQTFKKANYNNTNNNNNNVGDSTRRENAKGRRTTTKLLREEQRILNEKKAVHKLIYPNIPKLDQPEPTRFKKEAYQLQFEKGLYLMYEYLNSKIPNDFPYLIDTHKIFVNINHIPHGRTNPASSYYLEQLLTQIEALKVKCYEMKLNGLSRVLMPITANKDIISNLREIFNLHVTIDNVMGDYLLHEQYIFIYNKIKFITESSLANELLMQHQLQQAKEFKEERVPRYILFEAMCHSVNVYTKMFNDAKENETKFEKENYYQILYHELDSGDNIVLTAYEISKELKKVITDELQVKKSKLENEIKKYGRFWLMEGFFNAKNDKDKWITAIELLYNINKLVREDIRDYLLMGGSSSSNSNMNVNASNSKQPYQTKSTGSSQISKMNSIDTNRQNSRRSSKVIMKQKSKITKRKRDRLKSESSSLLDDSFEKLQKKLPTKLDGLRPPAIWNYPIERIQEMKNLKKENEIDIAKTEIRDVDPRPYYYDKRVYKFMELFEELYLSSVKYCNSERSNIWRYMLEKVGNVFGIEYYHEEKEKKVNDNDNDNEYDEQEDMKIGGNNVIATTTDGNANKETNV
jgi:hypothetical protein